MAVTPTGSLPTTLQAQVTTPGRTDSVRAAAQTPVRAPAPADTNRSGAQPGQDQQAIQAQPQTRSRFTAELSSQADLDAAAQRIDALGAREAPFGVTSNASSGRDVPLGQIVNILV